MAGHNLPASGSLFRVLSFVYIYFPTSRTSVETMQAEKRPSGGSSPKETGSFTHNEANAVPQVELDYPNKGSAMEKRMMRRIDLRLVPVLGEISHAR